MGLSPHPLCLILLSDLILLSIAKQSYPSQHCSFCPPLFPVLQKGARNSVLATFQHCSPQQISYESNLSALTQICLHSLRSQSSLFFRNQHQERWHHYSYWLGSWCPRRNPLSSKWSWSNTRSPSIHKLLKIQLASSRPFKPSIFKCQSFQDLTDGFGWDLCIHNPYLLCSCLVLRSPLSHLLIADRAWFPLQTRQTIEHYRRIESGGKIFVWTISF